MPSIISLIPDEKSTRAIQSYLTENASLVGKPKNKFHSTLIYTETFPVFQRDKITSEIKSALPIVLNHEGFSFDVFGDGTLGLKYHDKRVLDMETKLLREGLRQCILEWPDLNKNEEGILRASSDRREGTLYDATFNPHISIASEFSGDTSKLPKFPYELTLADISWKHKYQLSV